MDLPETAFRQFGLTIQAAAERLPSALPSP